MQPSTTQRPVMDVTARRPQPQSAAPARPATSLAVHQAPATEEASATTTQPVDDTGKPLAAHEAATPSPKANADAAPAPPPETKKKPAPRHTPAAPSATGAIVTAVVVMVALSALAIAVYLKG